MVKRIISAPQMILNMEQRTVTIKIFLRIIYPNIHLRRMAYPSERKEKMIKWWNSYKNRENEIFI